MGKKSLIKSTAKKKKDTKEGEEKATKKAAAKKTKKAAAAKKTAAKKTATKKAAAKKTKKATPKKTAATKKTATKKKTAATKKAAPKKTKKTKTVSIKDLVFKKFEPTQPVPEIMAAPEVVDASISAPPLIDSDDPKEVERLQALLLKKYDMAEVKAAAKEPPPLPEPTPEPIVEKPAPKAEPAKPKATKPVSMKELVFKKFEPTQAVPDVMAAPVSTVASPSAPPLIAASDPKEAERLQALLLKKYDMAEVKAAAKEPPPLPEPTPEPVAEKPAPVEETPADQKAAKAPEAAQPAESKPYVTMDDTSGGDGKEPMSLPIKIAIALAAAIVFLTFATSYNNGSKYYIHPKDDGIEIWKGRFSPKDDMLLIKLDGVAYAEPVKAVYAKTEIYPLIFDYYVAQADDLLEKPGLPDFKGIKEHLFQAKDYIVTNEAKKAVTSRLNNIDRMILLYKADVAISQNTEDSLRSAIKLLKEANTLTTSTALTQELNQKVTAAREQIKKLKADAIKQAEAEKALKEAEAEKARKAAEAEKARKAAEAEKARKAAEAIKAAEKDKIKEELKAAPDQKKEKTH